jgi:hypothetical protein
LGRNAPRVGGALPNSAGTAKFGEDVTALSRYSLLGAAEVESMIKRETFAITDIYVPVKRRVTLKADVVEAIASSILEVGQETPILVRRDGERLVLVEGLHRLEACKALGEATIIGYVVQARKH